jgi:hypothetical protein
MPNTANVSISVQNQILGVGTPSGNVIFVMGKTLRGPNNDASTLINSPQQFVNLFGGEIATSTFPKLALALLASGAQLRVCSVKNTPVKAPALSVLQAALVLFTFRPKYAGLDYNNITVNILAASNGNVNYFNLSVVHALEPGLNELYPNLTIPGKPTVPQSNYLLDVIRLSKLIDVTYADISILAGTTFRPTNAAFAVVGGTDGTAVADTDYVGSVSAKTGFYAFNDYNEAFFVIAPEVSTAVVNNAGAAYCNMRQDLEFAAHLDNTNVDAASLVTARALITEDHPFYAIYAGGLKIPSSDGNSVIAISEVAHVVMQFTKMMADSTLGPWWSFAGPKRGNISGTLGVVNNFGSAASYNDLNQLANNQINVAATIDGVVRISGNFTGQKANNQQSFLSIQLLTIYIKKVLRPILDQYKEDPTDLPTFRQIYYNVKPFLDNLAKQETRCLWGYDWQGDQKATSLNNLQVNNKADVLMGKYKMVLKITPIASMQQLTLSIILTSQGVQFSTQ